MGRKFFKITAHIVPIVLVPARCRHAGVKVVCSAKMPFPNQPTVDTDAPKTLPIVGR